MNLMKEVCLRPFHFKPQSFFVEQKAHKEVHQREAQITEYQDKLQETRMKFESLQNEYKQLQSEKVEFNETIDKLQRNLASAQSELENQGKVTSS